jgi:hypothetical protein
MPDKNRQGFSRVLLILLAAPSPARICRRNAAEDGGLSAAQSTLEKICKNRRIALTGQLVNV